MDDLMKLQELNEKLKNLLEEYEEARMEGDEKFMELIKRCIVSNTELTSLIAQKLK